MIESLTARGLLIYLAFRRSIRPTEVSISFILIIHLCSYFPEFVSCRSILYKSLYNVYKVYIMRCTFSKF